ncbi:MAG: tetratricopeptide repeat protein [Burkholderiales bacterium]
MSENPFSAADASLGSHSGISAAAKYNPHLWSPDELRNIFVVRQRELETLLQALRAASPKAAPQHMLITGQRGMGKSTLLQRAALAVEDDAALNEKWLPLRFPEEQYTVSTPAELWTNVIGALADNLDRHGQPTQDIDADLARLTARPAAQREDDALAWLKQWCATHKRRLLLLIDSTDLLFDNLAAGDAGKRRKARDDVSSALWRVRKTLSHSPHLLWLGGSYQPLESRALYSDAFLDFFQLIELRPLSLAEMQTAIEAMARIFGAGRGLKGADAQTEVRNLLGARPERLRAMRQLTGGNPRTTVMLYELFAAGGKDNLRADLERLLDAMTPLYKARLEILADQPRKVLAHVMEHWAPISTRALADAATLPAGTVSAQLSRLEQEGQIEKVSLGGTKRFGYQASERFFNIWYLIRNAPRGARVRVGWLVEFMRLWYSRDELQGLARLRWTEHRDGLHIDDPELEYSRAIARAMPEDEQDRRLLDWEVFRRARNGPSFCELYELQGEDADYSLPHNYLERLDALRNALWLAPMPEEEKPVWTRLITTALHLTLAEKEALARNSSSWSTAKLAEVGQELVVKREGIIALHNRASVERLEEAVAEGRFFPDCPQSELAYTQMLDCFESTPSAFAVALVLLASRRGDAPVEKACKKAIELAPTNARTWRIWGDLLRKLNRHEEAEVAYRKAIELDPKWAWHWIVLGDLLRVALKRYDEAEVAYRKAIELNPKLAWPWRDLGILLNIDLKRYEEAEAAYRKAIELDPRSAWPWCDLGNLLRIDLKRYEEAEAAYRKAIEFDPTWARPWAALGELLRVDLKRYDEAEVAYRKTIELDPKSAWPWGTLGDLLRVNMKRYEEAEAAYRRAIELAPKSPDIWNTLGDLLGDRLARHDDAEFAYRKAMEYDPSHPFPVANLARLLAKLERNDEASVLYRQSLTLVSKDNDNLRLQAHCWLGNSDLALQALDALTDQASKGDQVAFYQLNEQCFECNAIGLSKALVALMARSRSADFLQPFALALRAASGDKDALLDVAVEVRSMAEEVLAQINGS